MSTRISDAIAGGALLLVAACSGPSDRTANAQALGKVETEQRKAADDEGRILCARRDAPMARGCTIERTQTRGGLTLTVSHDDDGGFHRLLVTRDGRGVVAADGAEPATVRIVDGGIEVAIGGDRYRLPATIRAAR